MSEITRGESRCLFLFLSLALFAFKAQLCGIRFPREANLDLGQQVHTIRMHNAHRAHVNCPARRRAPTPNWRY